MPRFVEPASEFVILTGPETDPITWRFGRTSEVERDFTLADDPARSRPHARTMLPVMLSSLADWEGVLDASGHRVEYSEQAFYQYIPSSMRLELLSRWTQRMRGTDGGTGGTPAVPSGGTHGLVREEVPGFGSRVPGSTAGRQPKTPNPELEAMSSPSPPPHERAADATLPPGCTRGLARDDVRGSGSAAPGPTAPDAEPGPPNPEPPSPSETEAVASGSGEPSAPELDLVARAPGPPHAGEAPLDGPTPASAEPALPAGPGPAADGEGGPTFAPAAEVRAPSPGQLPEALRPPPAALGVGAQLPEARSLLDAPDLDMDWDFEDAVEAVVRRKQLAEQHEPLY